MAACTNKRGPVATKLVDAGCTVVQDADDGVNAKFPVEAFDEVAEIMKPRKRRTFTDEQKQELTARLRRGAPTQDAEGVQERTITPVEVSPVVQG